MCLLGFAERIFFRSHRRAIRALSAIYRNVSVFSQRKQQVCMRKRTHRKPVTGMNPFQKAVARRAWQADSVRAGIHAFIGEDVVALTQLAGGVIYAMVAGCEEAGIGDDDPDVLLLHDAGRAILELAKQSEIGGPHRKRIIAGLAAGERLMPRLNLAALTGAAREVGKASEDYQ